MIKLLLNPTFKLMSDGVSLALVSEVERIDLPLACLPLLTQLQHPTVIDAIAPDDAVLLEDLAQRRLLLNANLHGLPRDVAGYWLARHYYPPFTADQLGLSVEFCGVRAPHYRALFASMFPECRVVDADGHLLVCITDDLLACAMTPTSRPVVPVKVGGIKQSIGPVLSPAFSYADLVAAIARPFAADLSVTVPAGIQAAADHLLMTELYQLRVQAGAHLASRHVIEWNMHTLSKTNWKVKPL